MPLSDDVISRYLKRFGVMPPLTSARDLSDATLEKLMRAAIQSGREITEETLRKVTKASEPPFDALT